MNPTLVFYTVACVFGISCGQLLFKKAASSMALTAGWQGLIFNTWLWLAFILYGTMTILWVWILKHAPLHIAYPFMGLAFLIVPVLARIFIGEPLHWQSMAGGVLILAGITLASVGSKT